MKHHTVISKAFHCATHVVLIPLLLFSCAGKRSVAGSIQSMPTLMDDTIGIFKAAGEVSGSYKGEKFRGRIAVIYDPGNGFNCDIYSSFAHTIASVVSDNDSALISVGELAYRIGIYDSITFIPFFNTFPFIFNDFVRILTGRVIMNDCLTECFDAFRPGVSKTVLKCVSDSMSVSCLVSKSGKKIKNIEYKALRGVRWTIIYSSFKNGISRQIQYTGDEKNKFSLKFDEITY